MRKIVIFFKVIHKKMRRAWRRMRPAQRRLLCFSLVFMVIGGLAGGFAGKAIGRSAAEKKAQETAAETQKKLGAVQRDLQAANRRLAESGIQVSEEEQERVTEFKDGVPWNMTLVNTEHPLAEGYVPELVEVVDGYMVDSRIVEELNAMLAAAKEGGIDMNICSAYRSEEKQAQVFNTTVQGWMDQGTDYWTAYQNTTKEVALPGTSEHGLGLALDIVDNSYAELDEGQAATPTAQWLQQHCTEYGFILRYPADKESATGIIYEAWHYRYVGKDYAKKIQESGLTLEEYLGEIY